MIEPKAHKAIIDKQKDVAKVAGKTVAHKVIDMIPMKQLTTALLNRDKGAPDKLSKVILVNTVRELQKPVDETLKIGSDFAKVKLGS